MRSTLHGLLGATVVLLAACGEPEPIAPTQLVLFVETDAPVPRAGLGPDDLVLFDRLRISVFRGDDASPCAGCTRDFVLSSEPGRDLLSVGIAREAAAAVAHVELYADRNLDAAGNPDVGSAISAWITLPRPEAEETKPLYLELAMREFGVAQGDRSHPIEAGGSPPAPLLRWPEARRVACTATPGPEEACVPGGVVWMGNALRRPGPGGGIRPRMVRLSPFLVDLHEVTVGAMRASGLVVSRPNGAGDPKEYPSYAECPYESAPGKHESWPVTCLTHELAATYCAAHGAELPTEAQFEYLQGGLRGTLYPWGNDDPSCGDAVFGLYSKTFSPCGDDQRDSVRPIGSGPRDVLVIGGRAVVDLAGNASEWAKEPYLDENAECNRSGYFVDPVCEGALDATHGYVTRGGSFIDAPLGLRSEVRVGGRNFNTHIGFRCVRAAR